MRTIATSRTLLKPVADTATGDKVVARSIELLPLGGLCLRAPGVGSVSVMMVGDVSVFLLDMILPLLFLEFFFDL